MLVDNVKVMSACLIMAACFAVVVAHAIYLKEHKPSKHSKPVEIVKPNIKVAKTTGEMTNSENWLIYLRTIKMLVFIWVLLVYVWYQRRVQRRKRDSIRVYQQRKYETEQRCKQKL